MMNLYKLINASQNPPIDYDYDSISFADLYLTSHLASAYCGIEYKSYPNATTIIGTDIDIINQEYYNKRINFDKNKYGNDAHWELNGPISNKILNKELYRRAMSKDFNFLLSIEPNCDTIITHPNCPYDIDSLGTYVDDNSGNIEPLIDADHLINFINKSKKPEYFQGIEFTHFRTPEFFKFIEDNGLDYKKLNCSTIMPGLDYPMPYGLLEMSVQEKIVDNKYYITFTSQIPTFDAYIKKIQRPKEYTYYKLGRNSIITPADIKADTNKLIRLFLISLLTSIITLELQIIDEKVAITDRAYRFYGDLTGIEAMHKFTRNGIYNLEEQANFMYTSNMHMSTEELMKQATLKKLARGILDGEIDPAGVTSIDVNPATNFDCYLLNNSKDKIKDYGEKYTQLVAESIYLV